MFRDDDADARGALVEAEAGAAISDTDNPQRGVYGSGYLAELPQGASYRVRMRFLFLPDSPIDGPLPRPAPQRQAGGRASHQYRLPTQSG